ncbi:MAG: sigma-54 dependent transcriptional regulator [Pseudomonadota bacterium]
MSDAIKVLLVDDDEMFVRVVRRRLNRLGYQVVPCLDSQQALGLARAHAADVVLLDIYMPRLNGFEVLQQLKAELPGVEVVMMTGLADMESVIHAMRLGAFDFLPKPFAKFNEVCDAIRRAVELPKAVEPARVKTGDAADQPELIFGKSPAMAQVRMLMEKVARSDAPVLILGESGTGKELIAREIHRLSRRHERPWIPLNCAALPESLQEAELFGYVKGAFTGAAVDKPGLFSAAEGGTLFLDEVGDLTLPTQTKLLRVLQVRQVRPVGASVEKKVDFRLLCATNVDLRFLVVDERFRKDLFFRVNVVRVEVPPLRSRRDDIPDLADHFLNTYSHSEGKSGLVFAQDALDYLSQQRWPGNVRELQNLVYRAVVMTEGDPITALDLQAIEEADVGDGASPTASELLALPFTEAKRRLTESFERQYLENALKQAKGKIAAAARQSHLDRSSFKRLARRHQILDTSGPAMDEED